MTETKKIPEFKAGDTLRVHIRVVEGESERLQMLEGTVIKRRGSGISETFTLRKNSFGVGVERTFPLRSPRLEKIEVVKTNKVRRAKLYYMRALSGKAARLEETGTGEQQQAAAPAESSDKQPKKEASGQEPKAAVSAPAA